VSVRVRDAVGTDAAGVAAVHVRSWQVGYRGLLPDDLLDGLSVEERTRAWRERLTAGGPDSFTLVADEDEGVLGFCTVLTPSRDAGATAATAEIGALYVDPSRWRTGIGASLLSAAVRRLHDDGWDEATLWVFDENDRARSFYDRLGFAPDGATRRDEDGPVRSEGPLQRGLRRALGQL
jgi:GNAT superfamily N-acetyltransferase